jgi:hypothetical protein
MTICAICGKTRSIGKYRLWTIRESWVQAGGWGEIPISARVHVCCDEDEQDRIASGLSMAAFWRVFNKFRIIGSIALNAEMSVARSTYVFRGGKYESRAVTSPSRITRTRACGGITATWFP